MNTTDISDELRSGIERWRVAVPALVASVGGVGARVVAVTPDGREHRGILERIADCQGVIVRADSGKRLMIQTEWRRPDEALADSVRGLDGMTLTPYLYQMRVEDLLCEIFAKQNPRFDAERFRVAVGKAMGE